MQFDCIKNYSKNCGSNEDCMMIAFVSTTHKVAYFWCIQCICIYALFLVHLMYMYICFMVLSTINCVLTYYLQKYILIFFLPLLFHSYRNDLVWVVLVKCF